MLILKFELVIFNLRQKKADITSSYRTVILLQLRSFKAWTKILHIINMPDVLYMGKIYSCKYILSPHAQIVCGVIGPLYCMALNRITHSRFEFVAVIPRLTR